ncbi:hypothetical protein C8J57DRAFT_1245417 [Mycena rebaudengoi]|nr:hypothetical protein C8J57DRAFT_1245417 [Mycena rebaudengoi]
MSLMYTAPPSDCFFESLKKYIEGKREENLKIHCPVIVAVVSVVLIQRTRHNATAADFGQLMSDPSGKGSEDFVRWMWFACLPKIKSRVHYFNYSLTHPAIEMSGMGTDAHNLVAVPPSLVQASYPVQTQTKLRWMENVKQKEYLRQIQKENSGIPVLR